MEMNYDDLLPASLAPAMSEVMERIRMSGVDPAPYRPSVGEPTLTYCDLPTAVSSRSL